jgi:hypothetical protein
VSAVTYDFLVIGTVKGGTTTLHYLLADNPRLSLPPDKEAPLFLADVTGPEVRSHVEHNTVAKPGGLRGKVTPLYMCDPDVAARIYRAGPSTKLVAILRDPVDRALSHWRMCCRFGAEDRPFADAVRAQLEQPERWRQTRRQEDGYVAYGEYGRILSEYREFFPADQILVMTTNDLRRGPLDVVQKVCSFLGIEAHVPKELGHDFNVTSRGKQGRLVEKVLWRMVPFALASRVSGPRVRRHAGELLDKLGVGRPGSSFSDVLGEPLNWELRSHYMKDMAAVPTGLEVDVWTGAGVGGHDGPATGEGAAARTAGKGAYPGVRGA